jgi:hypothetical protein
MRRLILSRETTSQVYNVAVIDSLITILSRGEFANSKRIIAELRRSHRKCHITPSGLKKYLGRLRRAGIDIQLKVGELTPEMVRDTFRELREKRNTNASIGQLCAQLQKKYGVSTNRFAAGKMLEKVRNNAPDDERSKWLASRSRKAYDHELRAAYRQVRTNLKERKVARKPAVSDILAVLEARDPTRVPSQSNVAAAFARINADRRIQGKSQYRFVRQAFPHLDRIEEASSILRESLGRAPTIPEISERLKSSRKEGEAELSLSQVEKGLRTLRRSRRDWTVALFSHRRRTNVYNEDIRSQYAELQRLGGRNPTRRELWEAVKGANPESNISFSGFDYRIKSLRRAGVTLTFKGSPKLSSEERRREREKARCEKREELARSIVEQEVAQCYPSGAPKFIQEKLGFFVMCVSVTLEQMQSEDEGRAEVRELIWVQKRLAEMGAVSGVGD